MQILHRRCAGLDVHKEKLSACIRTRKSGEKHTQVESRGFSTMTDDLVELRDWLRRHKIRQVAMESTGVYWIPVWNVLERGEPKIELMLVNPQQVQALPGKKTDQKDCERIAELLQYGLLRGSFVPPPATRQHRDLTRMRIHLQQDRNRVINRIGRLLQTANCKLSSVVSDIVGKTGKLILRALARGEANPAKLAECAQGTLQMKKAELERALNGRYTNHFRWLLRERLDELEKLDERLEKVERRLSEKMAPHADLIRRLCTIPGISLTTAEILIAELGTDMTKFPTSGKAASWAGLCPGNKESAGKRLSGRTRKGNRYLRRTLVQNAWAVAKKKDCSLTSTFFRIAAHAGLKKAAVGVAHKLITIAYCIIRDGTVYREQGGNHHDLRHKQRTANRLTRRLENLGFAVSVTEGELPPAKHDSPAKKRKRGRPCLCQKRGIICIHSA